MSEKKIENQKKTFEIRDYKPGDEAAICALFEKVFGKPMGKTESLRHWQWEFLENPAKPIAIKLAWDGSRLVGQEAANILRIYSQGKEYLALLIFDTMTDPDYQGLGIFTETAKQFYKDLSAKGYAFVFGFPNANVIFARTTKLNWKIIYDKPISVRPLDVGGFVSEKTKSIFLGKSSSAFSKKVFSAPWRLKTCDTSIEIRKEKQFDTWANELWDKCKNQHKLWVVRDYQYLSWRYDMRPESNYDLYTAWENNILAGYIITTEIKRKEGKIVFIADVLADIKVNGVVDCLLNTVIHESINKGAAMISSMVMPNSVYKSAFRKKLFIKLPRILMPQEMHFGAYSLDNGLSKDFLYDAHTWHISWGDTDLL